MKRSLKVFSKAIILAGLLLGTAVQAEEQVDMGEAILAENLPVGTYIQLGKYNDEPILWRYAADDENGKLMVSDKILCEKPFDIASMINGSHVRRSKNSGLLGGSNYWEDSNIRSWLNSDKPAGKVIWLCGNAPRSLDGDTNAYDNEKGFLANGNFAETERNVLKTVTQKSLLDKLDGDLAVAGCKDAWGAGGFKINVQNFLNSQYSEICYEYVTDRVFLLDVKQFEKVATGDREEGRYWLRTPFGRDYQYSGRDIYYSGYRVLTASVDINYVNAEDTNLSLGIRPAFYLDEDNAKILSGNGTAEEPYIVIGRDIHVMVNGAEAEFDQGAIVRKGEVYVPLRTIAEELGAKVSWEEEGRKVIIEAEETTVEVAADMQEIYINGEMGWLPAPVIIKNDRTLVPLQVLTAGLGIGAEWDENAETIRITSGK